MRYRSTISAQIRPHKAGFMQTKNTPRATHRNQCYAHE